MADGLNTPSDSELLRLSLAGEESAFALLYERLKNPLFRYAFYMTGTKAAAEEVTQEVFLALLKDAGRYRESKGDVAAFCFGIARNLIRRVRWRERTFEQLPNDTDLEKLLATQAATENVASTLIRDEQLRKTRAAIASLPDHYRQVIVMCDLCEFSYEEAACRLGCAVGTVRSRLSRARILLADKLKGSSKAQTEFPTAGAEECLI